MEKVLDSTKRGSQLQPGSTSQIAVLFLSLCCSVVAATEPAVCPALNNLFNAFDSCNC